MRHPFRRLSVKRKTLCVRKERRFQAIGINKRDIRRLYLAKYVVMAALAAVLGYAGSLFLNRALATNILLYSGRAPSTLLHHAVPVAAAALIFLIVLLSCALVLRRFNRISHQR